ncbi:MAG: prenyltransferase/squalene oxidase repeat-containing protein [Desulfosalsimonadaceae bacterium]
MINQNPIISNAVSALMGFANEALHRKQESIRIARVVFSLLKVGCTSHTLIFQLLADQLERSQYKDGGWSDPEETVWALSVIRSVRENNPPGIDSARKWLHSMRKNLGGWGYNNRDQARIPTTSLIAAIEPDILKPQDFDWLLNEWRKDFAGPVRLSYKAGFFLLMMPSGRDDELVCQTISHLADDQNDDGGFAPWKGHPICSDPWSTGVVLWGLSRWGSLVERTVLERALEWLQKTQLPSGYWRYHYLDDGTSLALIGAVSAMKALVDRK